MKPKKVWFIVAVGLQMVLLLVMIVPRWMILASGKTILLETAPHDPYDIFRGYYANLNYTISRERDLPGNVKDKPRSTCYVVLSKDAGGVWQARRVYTSLPSTLAHDEVVIRGRSERGWIKYGIEAYYLPENRRHEIEELLADGKQKTRVEVKVNNAGEAVIVCLHVAGKRFAY